MKSEPDADRAEQLLDGDEILTCTFATIEMLSAAIAAELGEDDSELYGLFRPRPALEVVAGQPESQAAAE